jgi:hypothetical protein
MLQVTVWQGGRLHRRLTPRKVAVFLAVRSEAFSPSRHFATTQQFGRFRSKADIQRAALPNRIYEYPS